jgi:5-methylthioadenosine/S-adenosylhomocysteine deaminase
MRRRVQRPGHEYLLLARHLVPVEGAPRLAPAELPPDACPVGVRIRGSELVAVGDREELDRAGPLDVPVLTRPNAMILPGLVNTHTHLEITGLRHHLPERDLFTWIQRLVRMKRRIGERGLRLGAVAGAAELAAGGTTTCADTGDGTSAVAAMREVGLRGISYVETFSPIVDWVEEALVRLERRLRETQGLASGSLVTVGVSPHAPYSVCPDHYRAVTRLALERRLPMAVHLAESTAELDFLRDGSGPFGEWYALQDLRVPGRGLPPVRYLEDLGVLAARPLVVHAVQLEADDPGRLVSNGATVAHCPRSNAHFGHGVAPVPHLREAGIAVGLGTDGAPCTEDLDLLAEVRVATVLHGGLSREERLRLLTLDGARALGLGEQIGSLVPGKQADLAVLVMDWGEDPLRTLLRRGRACDVCMTVVGGEVVYLFGYYAGLEPGPVTSKLREIGERLRGDGVP